MTVGAVTGATIAFVNNKEKVLETTEYILQKGANYCRHRLEKLKEANLHYADSYGDAEFSSDNIERATGASTTGYSDTYDDEEASTPEGTDYYDSDVELICEDVD